MEKEIRNFKEMLDRAFNLYGNRNSYEYFENGEKITKTFADLRNDSFTFAAYLNSQGIENEHIALLGSTSYWFAVSFMGICCSNNVAVTLDVRLSPEEIAEKFRKADVTAAVFENKFAKIIDKTSDINFSALVEIDSEEDGKGKSLRKICKKDLDLSAVNVKDDFACTLIMFTSGTSGKSKGVMMHQKGLVENAIECAVRTGYSCEDRILNTLPMYHIAALSDDLLWGLYLGACVCIVSSIGKLFTDSFNYKVSCAAFVPMYTEYLYKQLLKVEKDKPGLSKVEIKNLVMGEAFKTITTGAAPLTESVRNAMGEYGVRMVEQYGMTEAHCNIATTHGFETRNFSTGPFLKGFEYKIVDGQLFLKGDMTMLGYYKDEESTREVLKDGWLATGDLAEIDSDGYLYLKGRKKLIIILSNGENVSVEKLENDIKTDRLVKEVVVYQKNDQITAQIFADKEVIEERKITDLEKALSEVIKNVNKDKPLYMHIQRLEIRDKEFEKTSSNKIKRAEFLNCK